MKSILFAVVAGLITAVSAAPPSYSSLEERQLGTTSNELKQGACKDVTFIMARGSTEIGNMVSSRFQSTFLTGSPKLWLTCSACRVKFQAHRPAPV